MQICKMKEINHKSKRANLTTISNALLKVIANQNRAFNNNINNMKMNEASTRIKWTNRIQTWRIRSSIWIGKWVKQIRKMSSSKENYKYAKTNLEDLDKTIKTYVQE